MMKKRLFIVLSGAILIACGRGITAQDVGDAAPDFTYNDLNGVSYSLSQFEGKVVFIFVFGNQCPYCQESGEDTETKINQVFGERPDFQALGVDTWDWSSSVATVQYFKDYTRITYPLLLKAGSFETLYSTSYDKAVVIGKDGKIKHNTPAGTHIGDDLDNVAAVIDQLFMPTAVKNPGENVQAGLAPVFPNPADYRAVLQFSLAGREAVSIRLFNPLGQEVRQVLDEVLPAGTHRRDLEVSGLKPGIYLVRMEAGGQAWTRRMQVRR
jgi:peroxiredoxin